MPAVPKDVRSPTPKKFSDSDDTPVKNKKKMPKRQYHSPPALEELEGSLPIQNSPNNLDFEVLSDSLIDYIFTYK